MIKSMMSNKYENNIAFNKFRENQKEPLSTSLPQFDLYDRLDMTSLSKHIFELFTWLQLDKTFGLFCPSLPHVLSTSTI